MTVSLRGLFKLTNDYGSSNNNGNVRGQTITAPKTLGGTWTATVSYAAYDPANRLKTYGETGGWAQTYAYDQWGNRAVTGSVPDTTLTPATLGAFNANTNQLSASVYDSSGNQKQDAANRTFSYDAENRQTTFNGTAAKYTYDGEGRRVKREDGAGTRAVRASRTTEIETEGLRTIRLPFVAAGGAIGDADSWLTISSWLSATARSVRN